MYKNNTLKKIKPNFMIREKETARIINGTKTIIVACKTNDLRQNKGKYVVGKD